MPAPVCTRCQKIYPEGSTQTTCVNCGGAIKVPEVKAVASQAGTPKRKCFRAECNADSVSSTKFFYDGKRLVVTPLTPIPDRDAQDLCEKHTEELIIPAGWTKVNELVMPSHIDQQFSDKTPTPNAGGSGCMDVFAIIAAILVFAVLAYAAWEILAWLFSQDWSSGDSGTKPFRIPFRRRR
jgi:hypothetical protein